MLSKNMRILVTGGQGFIGSHLIQYLRDLGFRHIYSVSRSPQRVNNSNDEVNYITADLRRPQEVKELLKTIEPQIIYHLAADARTSRNIHDLRDMMDSNINSVVNILSSIVESQFKIDCFVYAGSCEEYGLNNGPFTENMVTDPISLYSGTKAAASALVKMYYNMYQIPTITLRPSLVYGPGQSQRFFIPQLIDKFIANETFQMTYGEQTRDFIYVKDVVTGLVDVVNSPSLFGEVVNLSFGSSIRLREIVQIIAEITGSKSVVHFGAIPYRENEIMSYEVSNYKLRSNTSWEPKVNIDEGLNMMISQRRGESI